MRRIVLMAALVVLLLGMAGISAGQDAPAAPLDTLTVTDVLPGNDSTGIETNAAVTVIFNRPVVPLLIVEDMDSLPQPLIFEPAVAGKGEWLNTAIYLFRPEAGFAGGTEYQVTVDPQLTTPDGAKQATPFRWSFTTVAPRVTSFTPSPGSENVRLNIPIQVRFNQPMDQAAVEESFALMRVLEGGGLSAAVPGGFEWADDGSGFRFIPTVPLELESRYVIVVVDPDLPPPTGVSGGLPLEGQITAGFRTVGLPRIVSTTPADGSQNARPYGGFTIRFSSPMNVETLRDKVTIEPEPWRVFDDYYYEWSNEYTLSFPTEPSTDYTITIAPGMEDIYGNAIETGMVVKYRTGPYDPTFDLKVPGDIGFYNARAERTQLFVTHRNIRELYYQLFAPAPGDYVSYITGRDNAAVRARETFLHSGEIPATAPQDRLRYDLLRLGGYGALVDCPNAPKSRLNVGDLAIVVSTPDPIRARSEPVSGEIVELLYRDYALPVTGGPRCLNDLLWWQVQLRSGELAWVAEGTQEEYFLDVRTRGARTPIDAGAGAALPPGIYRLRVNSPQVSYAYNHVMVVGTANLTMKQTFDEVTIWATDVNTGQPIPNAPITLYDGDGGRLGAGVTDADGILTLSTPRTTDLWSSRVAILQTDEHFGVGSTGWDSGISGYQFGVSTEYYTREYAAYLYTDRPVYRPDQPVYFRGVLRAKDDMTYTTPPSLETIPVEVFNDRGDVVFEAELPLTEYGTFNGEFTLDPDAMLGFYRIQAKLPDTDEYYYYDTTGSVFFIVAEYRLPEFQVSVTPEMAEVVQGDTIRVPVEARYYFGGLVDGAQVTYNVVASAFDFRYTGQGFYSFRDYNRDASPGEYYFNSSREVASGTGMTDAQGMFTIELPAELTDPLASQTYTIEATVTDESQQSVSNRAEVTVHAGQLYVGVRSQRYVVSTEEEARFDLIAVDWESDPLPNVELEIEVVERRWFSVQELGADGRTIWNYEVEETPVTSGSVMTDSNGRAVFGFTPPNGGVFKLMARARDGRGNQVLSANTVYVYSSGYVTWRQQNSNRIDLVADREDYNIGDTAEILIMSPFQGTAEALVTVERAGVLKAERITMESNSTVYRLPIEDAYAPNVFVSVFIVKGVDENNPVAAFRMGMVRLRVETTRRQLTISATPDVEQAQPGETVTYSVRVTNWRGEPVQAEIGAGLTDLAALSLGDPNSPPLMSFFYSEQGLGTRTGATLTLNTDQLTQEVLDTIKGGGGGFGEGGIFDIRQDFIDTPYWNPSIVTNADGEAQFSVTMPDNLTTFRLDVRAVTRGSETEPLLVGQETFDLISTKPLLIRPVTPRFFVVDDRVTLAAVVNNNTPDEQTATIRLLGDGVTFDAAGGERSVTIAPGGRARVEWEVTVQDVPTVDLTFIVSGNDGQYTDASKPVLGQGEDRLLPVYRYEAQETVGTSGTLRSAGERTETILLPQDYDVTQGELSVRLQPSLAGVTLDALEVLKNFPHQCVEQTVSRFLPNIMSFRALNELGYADPQLEAMLREQVNFGLQRLYAQQRVDGGWGWFVSDSSSPLTTAYAVIALYEAKEQGFAVSTTVMHRAQNYLRTTFIVPSVGQEAWRLNRQAFTLYALARTGSPDISRMIALYDRRSAMAVYAKAFLALAFGYAAPNDGRIETLMSDILNAATVSATGTYWDDQNDYYNWNTDTRTTALALAAFVKLRPNSELLPNIVNWLMSARQADSWETTQETAWAVMALTDWMIASGELTAEYDYSVALNGETLAQASTTPGALRDRTDLKVSVAELLRGEANRLLIGRTGDEGALYYTAHLRMYLPVPEIEPLNRGIILERRYVYPDDPTTSITSARVGELVQARLTVIVPNALHYVVIEDPIPAGADAVNPNLNTSQQIGTRPTFERSDDVERYGWGWWWFSNIEFRDEKVNLYATYLPAGTYEFVYTIRPGLAGVYNVIPPTGSEFYFPEVYGRGAGSSFTILPPA